MKLIPFYLLLFILLPLEFYAQETTAALSEQVLHFSQVDTPPEIPVGSVQISKKRLKKLKKEGKSVTADERLLTAIYHSIRFPLVARVEKFSGKGKSFEVDFVVDETGKIVLGKVLLLNGPGKLGTALDEIVVTALTTKGSLRQETPKMVEGTAFTEGEVALAVEVQRVIAGLPDFTPGETNGGRVPVRVVMHFRFNKE